MELPGDLWKPYIGLVNQTSLAPVLRILPWKMSRMHLEPRVREVDTDHNAVPGFSTGISAKRSASGTIHNASFDPLFTLINSDPGGTQGAFRLHEGMYFRLACVPNTAVAGARSVAIGEVVGLPIFGAAGELLSALPTNATTGAFECYVFLACLVTRIRHEADASAGQPFDFDFRTVHAYAIYGETSEQLARYGFLNNVGSGGFC